MDLEGMFGQRLIKRRWFCNMHSICVVFNRTGEKRAQIVGLIRRGAIRAREVGNNDLMGF
jgi:hypothetical protein